MKFLKKFSKAVQDSINANDIIPIFGLPGSGKTFFISSLSKWIFNRVNDQSEIIIEGQEHLNELLLEYGFIEIDPSTRCVKSNISPTQEGESHDVLLRIPSSTIKDLDEDLYIFTRDAPGEILNNNVDVFESMLKKINGLIFLIDIFRDDPEQTTINWSLVHNDARKTLKAIARIMDNIDEFTPIAFVITKADRRHVFEEFSKIGDSDEDKKKVKRNVQLIRKKVKQAYTTLIKQRNVGVFFHSSIGDYIDFEEAFDNNKEFPCPYGIENILKHCIIHQ